MPKRGDIELPNTSGKVDPRLSPAARAQAANANAFHKSRADAVMRSIARDTAPKKSPARRAYDGVRALMSKR